MDLHGAILQAHASDDAGRLADLYDAAGDAADAEGDLERACFFWTQSYVLALEAGSDAARITHTKLARHRRL